jgi:APA family basic amino acid/polyamine antiporter
LPKNEPEKSDESGFKRKLNLFDSTSIVIGSMIGSGIFIVSADIARSLGSPGWLMVVWVTTGLMTVFAALSYGELAGMMPRAGGQYIYLREAFSPLVGFLYGWTLFLVIQTGTIAAVAMAFGKFTGVLFPWVSEGNILFKIGFLKFSSVHLMAISSIALLTYINTVGISMGKWVQNIFTVTKIGILLAFILIGLFLARNMKSIDFNHHIFWDAQAIHEGLTFKLVGLSLIAGLATAMVGSLFSSDAWNNITFAAGEIINPKRNIPLSLFLGTITVTILYLLTNFVYIQSLPLRGDPAGTNVFDRGIAYALNDRLGTASMSGILGESAGMIMAGLVVISTFGCNNGIILSGARVYFAMAKDALFFRKAGELNKSGVPSRALILQGIWASILCISGTYSNLLDYVMTAVLLFYVLSIAGIFILRIKKPDEERPYKAFGYPLIPALYIIMASFIILSLILLKPQYTWPGIIIVLLGVPVYYFWRRRN